MTNTFEQEAKIEKVKGQVELYLEATQNARELSERDRDYRDGIQWTAEEVSRLRARQQAPVVINRIKPKVKGLIGLWDIRKSDPKAYPRTQKHEQTAEVITDALRFVADNNDFHTNARKLVAENFFCEGTGGAIVDAKQQNNGEIDIQIRHIPWDRIYYDPFSRNLDFSDSSYSGIVIWMGEEEFKTTFPNADIEEIYQVQSSHDNANETFDDVPRWVDTREKRIRVCNHYYLEDNIWYNCYFTCSTFLIEPFPSDYLDEDGEPTCPIELISANIDRRGNRYGEVRSYISPQDEINHRRSKALHLLSQRQTFGIKGTQNVAKLKNELAKPNGHVEFQGETFGKDFGILPTGDMAQGQFELYQDAKGELDSVGFNAQLAGDRQQGDLSGKAIAKLQQAGTIELNDYYSSLVAWERRINKQVWARIKQFWDREKWIRVTDDEDNLRWVGLSVPITYQQFLEEIINDESKPVAMRRGAAAIFYPLMQIQDPRLQELIEVRNDVAEMEVDIILEQSFDTVNVQEEQFQILAQFAQSTKDIDIIELIELSQIRGKKELIEKIEKRRQSVADSNGSQQQMQAMALEANLRKTNAEAVDKEQQAVQKQIENQIIAQRPDLTPQVNV